MRDEWKMERGGKVYVLFAGLLNEGHEKGLQGIDEEIIQIPTEANGSVAIVKAVVDMGEGKTFSGIGDASPENVGRNIVPHVLRMASTRAKARALRDAVNVGITALEELGDDEPTRTPSQPTGGAQSGKSSGQRQNKSSKPASDSQKNYLRRLVGDDVAEFEDRHKPIDDMTVSEASAAIDALQGGE